MASSVGERAGAAAVRSEERRGLRAIVLPMIPGELLAVLVPAAVLVVMGRMGGDALYVRSLFHPIAFLFVALQAGFGITTQVATAMSHGRGAPREVFAGLARIARIGLVTAALVAGALILLAPALADLLAVQPGARADFVAFVRWVAGVHVLVLGPTLCMSALRGTGRAWPAVAVMLTVAVLEIGLIPLLGMGIFGVPVAAAAGNLTGLLLGLVLLRRYGIWQPGPPGDRDGIVGLLLGIGLPVAGSFLVIFASNLALIWVVSVFGPVVVSGYATAATVQSVIIVPGVALGSAAAILMNQRLGAGRPDRLRPLLRATLEFATAGYAVLALLCWLCREPLALALAGDPAVAAETAHYLGLVGPTYLLMGLVLAALTLMEQIGAGPLALTLNVAYFAAMAVIGGVLARTGDDPHLLYATVAVANLGGAVVLPLLFAAVRRAAARAA